MSGVCTPRTADRAADDRTGAVAFGSNAVRLSGREWLVAIVLIVASGVLLPRFWERHDGLKAVPDDRIPYELGNDYWFYGRYARLATKSHPAVVVGDSVVWGAYVEKNQTLSHYLNERFGQDRYANVGLDGSHPMALEGLLASYGGAIRDRDVILHCNPLWMTSDKHDLQTDKEFTFNHPRLVPQFRPKILCYTAPLNERLGVVVERNVPLFGWANHLRLVGLEQKGLATWTMEHPYACPIRAMGKPLPSTDKGAGHEAKPWTARGIDKSDFAWVEPDRSLQWAAFKRCIELLQGRGNRVFVVVGPFNEHLLTGKSVETYARIKKDMGAWLTAHNIPHLIPSALPSEQYADASHPLSEGYAAMARQVYQKMKP